MQISTIDIGEMKKRIRKNKNSWLKCATDNELKDLINLNPLSDHEGFISKLIILESENLLTPQPNRSY